MKKRKLFSAVMACSMVLALAGCGGNGNTPAPTTTAGTQTETTTPAATTEAPTTTAQSQPAGDAVTLKWAIWDQDATPYWVALKDAYEAENQNVTIELIDLGSTDYMTVLATQLSGSTSTFDVVSVKDVPGYATLVQKNTIEPLDDYISAANIDLSLYGGTTDQIISFRSEMIFGYYSTIKIYLIKQAWIIRPMI